MTTQDLDFTTHQPNNLGFRLPPAAAINIDHHHQPSSHQSSCVVPADGVHVSDDGSIRPDIKDDDSRKGGGGEEEAPSSSPSTTTTPPSSPCHTPRTPKNNLIPKIVSCPPAPKKSRKPAPSSCKRKLTFFEATARDEIESFFKMVEAASSSSSSKATASASAAAASSPSTKRRCLV